MKAFLALLVLLAVSPASAQSPSISAAPPVAPPQTSSERVRDNPSSQFVLIKTVVAKSIGVVDARALPVEPEGYNLLKYCWAVDNVLGDWAERAGLTGAMVTRALETQSWARDLVRAGYPAVPVGEAIGRYEAALIAAGFTDAARERALDALAASLDEIRRTATGAAKIFRMNRCARQARSMALNHKTAPEGGHARFIPYVLHQICRTQDLDANDIVRCDYWMIAKAEGPMSFPDEMVYSVLWPDGLVTTGHFDPDASRSAGIVTLRQRER
jgi:hypothetical protein